jgi:hypothetical protein
VAVAEETSSVSFAGGYRHRSGGVQVVLADHDDGDRELVAVGGGMVDEAVSGAFASAEQSEVRFRGYEACELTPIHREYSGIYQQRDCMRLDW